LSHPIPPDEATSEAIILSNISSMTVEIRSFFLSNSPTKSTASWEVRQSHIPSQASTRNAVSAVIFCFYISGTAVIIWSAAERLLSHLYSKSPRDLERFKTPLTLLSSTNPPAFSILYFSPGLSGLWSILISIAWNLSDFFWANTTRESPEFATIISVGVMSAEVAVQPVP
jgi:hypothetical protein